MQTFDPSAWAVSDIALVTILAMAAATYLTRIGGYWIMGRVPITGRVEAFLSALAGSVLIAFLGPMALQGGPVMLAAMGAGLVVMRASGQVVLAILAAVGLAVLLRETGVGPTDWGL